MATDSAVLKEQAAGTTDSETEVSTVSAADLDGLADADDSEAAAIAVAIAAHLRDRQAAAAAAAAAADAEEKTHRSWAFAGRLEAIGTTANRPPNNAPKNEWAAVGRADQF